MGHTTRADVVIVGSGVAGSLVAARLAKAGVKVLMLEAGPLVVIVWIELAADSPLLVT